MSEQNRDRPVTVRLGGKFNMGNYNNIEMMIEVQDYVRGGEKVSEAIDRVYNLVDAKLEEKLKEAGHE